MSLGPLQHRTKRPIRQEPLTSMIPQSWRGNTLPGKRSSGISSSGPAGCTISRQPQQGGEFRRNDAPTSAGGARDPSGLGPDRYPYECQGAGC